MDDPDMRIRSSPNATTTDDDNPPLLTSDGGATSGGEHVGKLGVRKAGHNYPGPKPTNFFELLAAAVSAAKMEQRKDIIFLEYLNKSGIKTAFIRSIVALYEEPNKPDDPLTYMVQLMGLGIPEPADVMAMQDEVKYLRQRVLDLQGEQEQLKARIEKAEATTRYQEELSSRDEEKLFSDFDSDEYMDADLVTGAASIHHFC